ncbi:hypothetical protein ACOBQJ_02250 [Pelotomaculum propionicicum]|uniref:hypothetical protein n=1 Tax=Pelotomaculum propionicicum TaxID=258475 RepID=UPI003B79A2A3
MKKEFEPKFIPDNPLTKNPYDPRDRGRISVPREDTHPGTGLRELNGEVNEVNAKNLLGEDE